MIGFDRAKVDELINLPEDRTIGFILVGGKRVRDPWVRPGEPALDEVAVTDKFA